MDLLAADDDATSNTSMRLPTNLRDAAALAVEHLGAASSTTALTATALRRSLETIALRAALDAHYTAHPDARPPLAEVALAAREQDGDASPFTLDELRAAAEEVSRLRPQADADDVLLWATAQRRAAS